ncbi:MAG: DUF2723 domain-containing protein [candidate division KSB1 bacterium]|nr:DUF2723 domain-containing protein [candidate division KSB1 bacterium]MDZ7304418.1 DUF2723 domain-containing protein [candidate division KSB1 bacterium]MDZ7313368.1 DUF2723 domain-containing protein [candidate division KSB1 bacterium]
MLRPASFFKNPVSLGGLLTLLIALATYLRTLAPTVSFWDCGEFIACSYILGVPHPPGAPLYLLLGRVFSMLPFADDIGWRVNLISALASTATILLTYLIILQLFREFRRKPEGWIEVISAVIGALAFTFSDSFWFNAVEAEVYALSMFFTAVVIWLALRWAERHTEAASIKYLLLIAYLIGLASGVHLLNVLAIPAIGMIIYFKRWPFSWLTFCIGIMLSAAALLAVYPGIVKGIPTLIQAYGGIALTLAIFAVILATAWTIRRKRTLTAMILLGVLLVSLGYSTYIAIFIRSHLDPAIDENDPETITNLVSYLNREQYGTEDIVTQLTRRKAPFWDYQIKEMYLRYFGWQFIGRSGDPAKAQNTIQPFGLMGLPFAFGLLGMYHHFRRDWRRASIVAMLFVLTGIAIVIYLNQPQPQPRERDYSYVGSFFAFALWIGFGAHALLEALARLKNGRQIIQPIVAGAIFFLVPVNLFLHNFHTHDRKGNYAASDYAYNLLNTCAPNAILVTNGDNDTFPLWYLQQVEGVRHDVSVVNLSLLNTNWYIRQLKNREPKVPMGLTDDVIDSVGILEWPGKRVIGIRIDDEKVFQRYFDEVGNFYPVDSLRRQGREMLIEIGPTYAGRFLRTQDLMLFEIISANQFRRPIYIGFNVPTENHAGLTPYLRVDGMALKLMPFRGVPYSPEALRHNLLEVYRYRGLNDPTVYWDDQTQGLLQSYRSNFLALAWYCLNAQQQDEALALLQRMEKLMPEAVMPLGSIELFLHLGKLYAQAGDSAELHRRLNHALRQFDLSPQQKLEVAKLYWRNLGDSTTAESLARAVFAGHPNWGQVEEWLKQLARGK